jgi:hypothetical protein
MLAFNRLKLRLLFTLLVPTCQLKSTLTRRHPR